MKIDTRQSKIYLYGQIYKIYCKFTSHPAITDNGQITNVAREPWITARPRGSSRVGLRESER